MTTKNKETDDLHAIYWDISQRREQAAFAREEARSQANLRNALCERAERRAKAARVASLAATAEMFSKEQKLVDLVEAEKKAFAEFSDRLAEFSRHRVYSVD